MIGTRCDRVRGKAALAGLLLLAAGGDGLLHAGPIYVTPTGTDPAGANWTTPTSLTNALVIGKSNDVIWLAQGTYTNSATFTVASNGISLYGGFTNGGSLADRDWNAYPTILDGKGQNRRVVTVTGAAVVLDGLVITNTYGSSAGGITKTAAGLLTLANCRLTGHATGGNGGGASLTGGSALMTNCVVCGNTASTYNQRGYGIYASGISLQVVDCLFSNNYGGSGTHGVWGVGLYFDNGALNVIRTDFIGNYATAEYSDGGGAVCLNNSSATSATFSNCVFRGNVLNGDGGTGYGGAMYMNMAAGKTATVANCTFKGNANYSGNGGAIYVSGGTLVLKNSILWTNVVGNGYTGSEICAANAASLVTGSYTCLSGTNAPQVVAAGWAVIALSNVMTNNPLYASATDVHLQSPAGRWDPAPGTFVTTDTAYSPCIDAGDPASPVGAELADNGSRINLGAYGGTAQASKSPAAAPAAADRGWGLNYTRATFSGELVNASFVMAEMGVCYGTNSVAGNTTNGWQTVGRVYYPPMQQTGCVYSVTSPHLLTNTTYYYQWYATNAYGASWTAVTNFTTGGSYPPGWDVGGGSNVIHVKQDAVGNGNGQDWYNAYTKIMDGYSAVSGARTNIWVAGGMYGEGAAITIGTNLTMIGGFAGTETNAAGRALTNALGVVTNYTVISGQGTHLCLGITAGNVWLDTLFFTNCLVGQAVNKAGVGALTMNNCRIVGNSGAANGSGGYFSGGTVLMTNCVVAGNTVTTYNLSGYGVYSSGANLQLVDCVFSNNYATAGQHGVTGVALYFNNGTLNALRTDFINNNAVPEYSSSAGGVVYLGNTTASASCSNCVFRGNVLYTDGGLGYGGAMWMNMAAGKTVTVANCTFKDNANMGGNGGAIYVSGGTLALKNSILWTNVVGSGYIGSEIFATNAASLVTGSYTCLSGTNAPRMVAAGWAVIALSNVMTNNPLFASATDLHLQSPAGRWNPAAGAFVTTDAAYSPCIDAGDPVSPVGDEVAPNGGRVNLGAYGGTAQASKSPAAAPAVADLGVGLNYTMATLSGQLVNASFVMAEMGVCYGTNSVAGNTTNGWQTVGRVYYPPMQQTGCVYSITSPLLLTNTTYYYRWFATNAYGADWTAVSNFVTGGVYPPGWGVGGGSNVIHVKKDAVGSGNGQDWYNAYTKIMDGYTAVGGARTNIWIAGGAYSEGSVITVGTNLTMIGGFAGTETNPSGRALTNAAGVVTNYTVFSGEGTHRCLAITAGNVWLEALAFSACSSSRALEKGGSGTLTMNNCRITGNWGGGSGSGGYFSGGTVLMTNCVVSSNTATTFNLCGFGLYSSGANLQLVDCLLLSNYGNDGQHGVSGVALYFDNGTLNALRTDFIGNSGVGYYNKGGTAIYLDSSVAASSFSNCVFRSNVLYMTDGVGFGGAMYMNLAAGKTVTVASCTFKDNANNSGNGGAIYVSGGTLALKNSILWTNTVGSGCSGREIFATNAASFVTNRYCCLTGTNAPYVVATSSAVVQWGQGVIANDPLFASATDVHLKSKAGRWDPATSAWVNDSVTSPCIDAGDPADPVGLEPMPNGHRINMGAYGGTAQASKTLPKGTIMVFK